MKKQNQSTILIQKALTLAVLFGSALFIVLNSKIPGVILGLLVMYLGIRYYFSVGRLKEEVYKSTSEFC